MRRISINAFSSVFGMSILAVLGFPSLALGGGVGIGWGGYNVGQITPCATNVVAVSAGAKHSLALKADGTVVGWGNSGVNVPVGLSNVVAVAAGRGNSLALKADGTVVGWNLGQGANPSNLSNILAISAGDN